MLCYIRIYVLLFMMLFCLMYIQSHIRTFSGRIAETILSLRFFIFQYGIVYKLNIQGSDTSLTVNTIHKFLLIFSSFLNVFLGVKVPVFYLVMMLFSAVICLTLLYLCRVSSFVGAGVCATSCVIISIALFSLPQTSLFHCSTK